MKESKIKKLNEELSQYESSLIYYIPIYEKNINQYDYCHRAKKLKQFSSQEMNALLLQEEQSRKIVSKYKSVIKYLKKKRMKIKKKLGIKDIPQNEPAEPEI